MWYIRINVLITSIWIGWLHPLLSERHTSNLAPPTYCDVISLAPPTHRDVISLRCFDYSFHSLYFMDFNLWISIYGFNYLVPWFRFFSSSKNFIFLLCSPKFVGVFNRVSLCRETWESRTANEIYPNLGIHTIHRFIPSMVSLLYSLLPWGVFTTPILAISIWLWTKRNSVWFITKIKL